MQHAFGTLCADHGDTAITSKAECDVALQLIGATYHPSGYINFNQNTKPAGCSLTVSGAYWNSGGDSASAPYAPVCVSS